MKRELIYAAVIGGVVGAVLVMAAGSFSPLGAQNDVADAEFGTITCRRLVVRYDGFPYATEINPISVTVSDEDGRSAKLRAHGVDVVGTGGKTMVRLGGSEDGGVVVVRGKDGEGTAQMAIIEDGGFVAVCGKDGEKAAQMAVIENGGDVSVYGRGDAPISLRAAMNVNEYGNGAINTWDKNGYRFATLRGNE